MTSINYPRTYAQTGEIAAYRPVRRPSRDAVISVVDGKLALDGVRYPIFFSGYNDTDAIPKDDAAMIAGIKRIVADGRNGLFLRDFALRTWTESAYAWGWWTYANNDAVVANRAVIEEAALVQFDKHVAYALDLGIECVYVDLEGFSEFMLRHPNQRALGTYQARGMFWSDEYRAIYWHFFSQLFTRTSTITGIRHCDNRRLIWKLNNENGFSDSFTRSTTSFFDGSTTTWFAKIVDGTGSTDNGYWYTELNAKLNAWRAAYAPTWTIPAWGRSSAAGFPKQETWTGWATAADRNHLIDFLDYTDLEITNWIIDSLRAEAPECVINVGTFNYSAPQASLMLTPARRRNTFCETHQYFQDGVSSGVKTGSVTTRKSIHDPSWSVVTNGGGWAESIGGVRARDQALLASECGQYGPNRWRYQRLYTEVILAGMHGYDIATFQEAQQYSVQQFTTDGRYMQGDHVNVGSPCDRLCARAIAPIHRLGFIPANATSFVINATPASAATYQYANKTCAMQGNRLAPSLSDGTENGHFTGSTLYFEMAEDATPTSDWTLLPKVTDAALASGYFMRNTATEKYWIKRGVGQMWWNQYLCCFLDSLVDKATADAVFTMPVYLSNMAGASTNHVLMLRSDGLWPLFTGPMKLFIHGTDFATDTVLQGSDYAQHAADALGSHNPAGEAYFLANDGATLYYSASNSSSWGSGAGTAADVRLDMPPAFTVNIDTTNNGLLPAGTDLEIFGITKDGIPVRLASTYAGGIWSFNYTATYPEYTLQPKVQASVRARH